MGKHHYHNAHVHALLTAVVVLSLSVGSVAYHGLLGQEGGYTGGSYTPPSGGGGGGTYTPPSDGGGSYTPPPSGGGGYTSGGGEYHPADGGTQYQGGTPYQGGGTTGGYQMTPEEQARMQQQGGTMYQGGTPHNGTQGGMFPGPEALGAPPDAFDRGAGGGDVGQWQMSGDQAQMFERWQAENPDMARQMEQGGGMVGHWQGGMEHTDEWARGIDAGDQQVWMSQFTEGGFMPPALQGMTGDQWHAFEGEHPEFAEQWRDVGEGWADQFASGDHEFNWGEGGDFRYFDGAVGQAWQPDAEFERQFRDQFRTAMEHGENIDFRAMFTAEGFHGDFMKDMDFANVDPGAFEGMREAMGDLNFGDMASMQARFEGMGQMNAGQTVDFRRMMNVDPSQIAALSREERENLWNTMGMGELTGMDFTNANDAFERSQELVTIGAVQGWDHAYETAFASDFGFDTEVAGKIASYIADAKDQLGVSAYIGAWSGEDSDEQAIAQTYFDYVGEYAAEVDSNLNFLGTLAQLDVGVEEAGSLVAEAITQFTELEELAGEYFDDPTAIVEEYPELVALWSDHPLPEELHADAAEVANAYLAGDITLGEVREEFADLADRAGDIYYEEGVLAFTDLELTPDNVWIAEVAGDALGLGAMAGNENTDGTRTFDGAEELNVAAGVQFVANIMPEGAIGDVDDLSAESLEVIEKLAKEAPWVEEAALKIASAVELYTDGEHTLADVLGSDVAASDDIDRGTFATLLLTANIVDLPAGVTVEEGAELAVEELPDREIARLDELTQAALYAANIDGVITGEERTGEINPNGSLIRGAAAAIADKASEAVETTVAEVSVDVAAAVASTAYDVLTVVAEFVDEHAQDYGLERALETLETFATSLEDYKADASLTAADQDQLEAALATVATTLPLEAQIEFNAVLDEAYYDATHAAAE